jgi:predicted ATPase with chaperone activity
MTHGREYDLEPRALEHREFYGELSLGGELRQTPKLLPALVEEANLR